MRAVILLTTVIHLYFGALVGQVNFEKRSYELITNCSKVPEHIKDQLLKSYISDILGKIFSLKSATVTKFDYGIDFLRLQIYKAPHREPIFSNKEKYIFLKSEIFGRIKIRDCAIDNWSDETKLNTIKGLKEIGVSPDSIENLKHSSRMPITQLTEYIAKAINMDSRIIKPAKDWVYVNARGEGLIGVSKDHHRYKRYLNINSMYIEFTKNYNNLNLIYRIYIKNRDVTDTLMIGQKKSIKFIPYYLDDKIIYGFLVKI